MITTRRSLLIGLTGLIAAPAIVRASSLMKVKTFGRVEPHPHYWMSPNGFYVYDGMMPLPYKDVSLSFSELQERIRRDCVEVTGITNLYGI